MRTIISPITNDKGGNMAANALRYTSHEGVERMVPIDTVRIVRPLSEEDRTKARESLKEKRGIDLDASRLNVRVEFADRSSKLARETLDAFKEQGVNLVNLGADRFVPAVNITAAEAFTKDDAERLKGEDYTLAQTFRSKVETRAGTVLSSATPAQVMDRRAKALELASPKAAPRAKVS